nr:class E sortase [Streptomyces sp. SID5468]
MILRTLSELCLTAGALTVLLVVHLLLWTGVRADRAMDHEVAALQDTWATAPPAATRAAATPAPAYRDGRPFAIMYIPRLGADWHKPVLEGTATGTLRRGLGHYAGTARLGATGNFAVAGHRRTYGDPFKDLPRLRPGDEVLLTDGVTWYTYVIDKPAYLTLPDDTGVIEPLPAPLDRSATPYSAPGRYLTLTTCDPEWGHSHRLIVWGHLDATRPVGEGMPTALPG